MTDTKTALLDSAERAARTRGIDGFSFADLSLEVGIRKPSIHYHFATKGTLTLALVQRYRIQMDVACVDIDSANPTGGARIAALVAVYRQALNGGTSLCLCVALSASRESLPAEVITQIGLYRQTMITWLVDAFAAGQSDGSITDLRAPQDESPATLSLLEGAQLSARAAEDVAIFDAATRLLLARVS